MSTKIVKSLTESSIYQKKFSGISLTKIQNRSSKVDIKTLLSNIKPKTVGPNFLAIVSYGLVGTIMKYAKEAKLVDIKCQWMYIISDTDQKFQDISTFNNLLKMGDNVALVYNTTKNHKTCVVSCLI